MSLITHARAPLTDYIVFVAQDGRHKRFASISTDRLSRLSPKFKACLSQTLREGLEKRITIQMPRCISKEFLLFLKAEKSKITCNTVVPLLEAAEEHCVDSLKDRCYDFLENNFSQMNSRQKIELTAFALLFQNIRLLTFPGSRDFSIKLLQLNVHMPVLQIKGFIEHDVLLILDRINALGPFELILQHPSADLNMYRCRFNNLRGFGNDFEFDKDKKISDYLDFCLRNELTIRCLNVSHSTLGTLMPRLEPLFQNLYLVNFYELKCSTLNLDQAHTINIVACENLTHISAIRAKDVTIQYCTVLQEVSISQALDVEIISCKIVQLNAEQARNVFLWNAEFANELNLPNAIKITDIKSKPLGTTNE